MIELFFYAKSYFSVWIEKNIVLEFNYDIFSRTTDKKDNQFFVITFIEIISIIGKPIFQNNLFA